MNELQNLYDVLVREGKYTKSFDEFQVQFEEDEYQDKVFNSVSLAGLYTKDINSFKSKYAGKQQGVATDDVTVTPTDTESASEDTSLDLPQVTKEDVGLSERYFVQDFNKSYSGMGYEAIQASYEEVVNAGFQPSTSATIMSRLRGGDKEYIGDFQDFVTLIAPPDEQGNRSQKT
ncbi:MAG TPA: hypothetical protein DF712_11155, partial [Balneola sp.]|nr:hypothetical protein [Balneola sp.]